MLHISRHYCTHWDSNMFRIVNLFFKSGSSFKSLFISVWNIFSLFQKYFNNNNKNNNSMPPISPTLVRHPFHQRWSPTPPTLHTLEHHSRQHATTPPTLARHPRQHEQHAMSLTQKNNVHMTISICWIPSLSSFVLLDFSFVLNIYLLSISAEVGTHFYS